MGRGRYGITSWALLRRTRFTMMFEMMLRVPEVQAHSEHVTGRPWPWPHPLQRRSSDEARDRRSAGGSILKF